MECRGGGDWASGCASRNPMPNLHPHGNRPIWLGDGGAMSTIDRPALREADIYGRLGMTPLINGTGTVTTVGGTLMPPAVIAAMEEAARAYVDLPLFLRRAGEYLAER